MKFAGKTLFAIGAIIFCVALSFLLGVFIGQLQFTQIAPSFSGISKNEKGDLFDPYIQAWNIVHESYLEQPVNDQALMQGSIKGMMEGLGDPYSSYLDPEQFREQNAPLEGEYTGIGAWVDTSGDLLVIISPMPDSPAEEVGVKPGDQVVRIDDEDVTHLDPSLVLNKILGPEATIVKISVIREGDPDILDFEITRQIILIPSVESEMMEGQIGYIHLYTFGENSYDEFAAALNQLIENGAENIILDLRNNTGGLVDSAIEITSTFLSDEIVLIEEWGDGKKIDYSTTKEAIALDIPLYVLVNQGTASASEITAGALQDHQRALLIGTTTFGKGLIQNWVPLRGDNGAVRVSIARWLTPNGRQIQDEGLAPDVEIEFTLDDFNAGVDPQLEKALEIITTNN